MNLNSDRKDIIELYIQTINSVIKISQMDENPEISSIDGLSLVRNIKMIDTTTLPESNGETGAAISVGFDLA